MSRCTAASCARPASPRSASPPWPRGGRPPGSSDAERAALALTEATTRIADRPESITDEIWADAAEHYDEKQLSGLLLAIGAINVWNRLNAATRQLAGAYPT